MLIHWKLIGNLNFVVVFLCARLNGVTVGVTPLGDMFLCSRCVSSRLGECNFVLGGSVSIGSRAST